MPSFQLYPAILTINDTVAQTQLAMSDTFPSCPTAHIDVLDGIFADNLTISPLDFPAFEFGELNADVHLMVEEPLDFVYELVSVKEAVPVRAVIVQVEHVLGPAAVIEEIRQQGWVPGVSLSLDTDAEELLDELMPILPEIKIWQVMGVPAGFQGQRYDKRSLDVLRFLSSTIGHGAHIEFNLDGGVTPALLSDIWQAGGTGAVVGSYIWKNPSPADQWQALQAGLDLG